MRVRPAQATSQGRCAPGELSPRLAAVRLACFGRPCRGRVDVCGCRQGCGEGSCLGTWALGIGKQERLCWGGDKAQPGGQGRPGTPRHCLGACNVCMHMCACLGAYLASKSSNQGTVQGKSSGGSCRGDFPGEVRGSLRSEMGLEGQEKPQKGMASHARDSRSKGVVAEAVATGAQPDKGPGTMVLKLGDRGTGQRPES